MGITFWLKLFGSAMVVVGISGLEQLMQVQDLRAG